MKEIGEFFKEKLADQQTPPPASAWGKITSQDKLGKYNKRQKVRRLFFHIFPPVVVLTLAILSVALLRNSNPWKRDGIAPAPSSLSLLPALAPDDTVETPRPLPLSSRDSLTPLSRSFQTEKRNGGEKRRISSSSPNRMPTTVEPLLLLPEDPEEDTLPVAGIPTPPAGEAVAKAPDHAPLPEKIREEMAPVDTQAQENMMFPLASDEDKQEDLSLPDAFSPNADGLNDQFQAIPLLPITDFNMMVYDRGGTLLFQTRDLHQGWSGEYKGNPLPSQSYVYVITYRSGGGEMKMKKGWVILLR